MARRRFFVDHIHHRRAEISGDEAHHLTRVLRVERGQQYEISDNERAWLATVAEAHKARVVFELGELIPPKPVPARIALYVSLIKFDHLEWIVEKGTELGVESFHFVTAARSERGLDRAAGKRIERWRKIAAEASQQSRRDHLPALHEVMRLEAALRGAPGQRFVLEEAGAPPLLKLLPVERSPGAAVALLTGPEGGWTDSERALMSSAGWQAASLGPTILRAETAAIAAASVVISAYL